MPEVDGRDGVDVGGCEGGLVAIAVLDVMGVHGVGHVTGAGAGAGASAGTIVVRCAVLGIENITAWIVHKFALGDVEASGVRRVLVVAVAAAVVSDANAIGVGDIVVGFGFF